MIKDFTHIQSCIFKGSAGLKTFSKELKGALLAVLLCTGLMQNKYTMIEQPGQGNFLAQIPIAISEKKRIKYIKSAAGIRSKIQKPICPTNGLSSIERYFHHMPQSSSQVVLTYCGRIQLPLTATYLSIDRILDVCKITAAEIYRTSSKIDYIAQTFEPLGESASDLKLKYNFTEFVDEDSLRKAAEMEVNQKFDLFDQSPLWSVHIIGPKELLDGITRKEELPKFYVICSFHHCIGDGLSGFAFYRLLMSKMSFAAFQSKPLDLNTFPITKTPPPILDNYINSNIFQVIPGILF
jgi:hypothetical protein